MNIVITRDIIKVAKYGYKFLWIERQPMQRVTQQNSTISERAPLIIETEVKGVIDYGTLHKKDLLLWKYVNLLMFIPKSKRSHNK